MLSGRHTCTIGERLSERVGERLGASLNAPSEGTSIHI